MFTKLINKDKKVAFIQVNEDGTLARSSEFISTCNNINIIVQTTGGDVFSINMKSEIPNNTLVNITRGLILKSIHKKELCCFSHQYNICISCQTENRLCGDFPCFLWHGSRTSYKNIKIKGVALFVIDWFINRNNLYSRLVISWDIQLL